MVLAECSVCRVRNLLCEVVALPLSGRSLAVRAAFGMRYGRVERPLSPGRVTNTKPISTDSTFPHCNLATASGDPAGTEKWEPSHCTVSPPCAPRNQPDVDSERSRRREMVEGTSCAMTSATSVACSRRVRAWPACPLTSSRSRMLRFWPTRLRQSGQKNHTVSVRS